MNFQNELPVNPIFLNLQEEQNLINDVAKELRDLPSESLKSFYNELTSYDPNALGFTHSSYVALCAIRNNVHLSDGLFRYVMSRYVSPERERNYVNYGEMIKFLARCIGNFRSQSPIGVQQPQNSYKDFGIDSNMPERFDPDEQAILRLMHENMREWETVNLIDIDSLRKKFYESDPYNRYILTMREVIDL